MVASSPTLRRFGEVRVALGGEVRSPGDALELEDRAQVGRHAEDDVLWQLMQAVERPEPRAALGNSFELIGESEFGGECDRLGATCEKSVGTEVDRSSGEGRRRERAA